MTDTPLVPNLIDTTVYLVLCDFGALGRAYVETAEAQADIETTLQHLINGEYDRPLRVIAFNVEEGWSSDMSKEFATEAWKRTAEQERAAGLRAFIDRHLGSRIHA